MQRSIGETYYKALFLEVKRRFSGGLQFNIAYTLAKAENLSGTGNGGGAGAEDPFGGSSLFNQFDLKANRAPAPTDQRHRFVVNGVWNLPELKQGSALARGLLNGYRLGGIFTAESGRPFAATISLPNIQFTLDGAQYTGFGGILGLGGLNLAPDVPRNSNYGDVNFGAALPVLIEVGLLGGFVQTSRLIRCGSSIPSTTTWASNDSKAGTNARLSFFDIPAMSLAANPLQEVQSAAPEVGVRVGDESGPSFSHAFRRRFGIFPRACRRANTTSG